MQSPESYRTGPAGWTAGARAYRAVRTGLEALFGAAYVVAVYELVVAGGIALWPDAPDSAILPMWIAAAALSGLGLGPVRAQARRLLGRLWPSGAADPYAALASVASGASAADEPEPALDRLARLTAAGTGARAAAVWLAEPDGGLRPGGRWPDGGAVREESGPAADLGALAERPGVDHLVRVADGGGLLGALTLTAPATRGLTAGDLRLAGDAANAAGQLLRNAELSARLAGELRVLSAQAAELDRSRRRVLAARDAAREQLGQQIQARVGEPLIQCSAAVSALLEDDPQADRERALAEMSTLIDTAVGDFRRIVHGVYPAVLTDHGLAAALENLFADLPRRTAFTARDLPRLGARVEAGVYFCVAALVGALSGGDADPPLQIGVAAGAAELTVTLLDPAVTDPAPPHLPDALRDRLDALEGTVETSHSAAGLRCVLKAGIA